MKKGWLLLVLIAFALPGCGPSPQKPGGRFKGQAAPDFALPFFQEPGRKFSLSATAGQTPVLLVFWATWCPPCVEEIPQLNEIQKRYEPGTLKIAAVNVGQSHEALLEFAREHDMNYDILMDEAGEVAGRYGVAGLPVAVLLAKGGEIIYYGFTLPRIEEYLPPSH
ncbi:MAG TPA: TlpA disulfide reductase family protein [Verrucomicrobiae bacterium]|jgi:peroxiredoxin|nr:TlpA disulfide reductase family protein [Verrucomicrobiae bacterium]